MTPNHQTTQARPPRRMRQAVYGFMRLRLPEFAHRAEPILLAVIVLLALAGMVIVVMVVIKSARSAELSNPPAVPPARRAAPHSVPPLPPGTELGHIPDSSRSRA